MPSAPIIEALARTPDAPCSFGPLHWWDDLPEQARGGGWDDAWRAYVRTSDPAQLLHAYARSWLAGDPVVPLRSPSGNRADRVAPDGRDGTLVTPGRDLDVCIELLGCAEEAAVGLRRKLIRIRTTYLEAHLEFMREARIHPRRHKFNDLFARVRYTRADIDRLDHAVERAQDALLCDPREPDDAQVSAWREWAQGEASALAARILITRALELGDLDGARSALIAFWATDERRRGQAVALGGADLERWQRWLVGQSAVQGSRAVIDQVAVLTPPRPGHLATPLAAPESSVARRVGFDRVPLEGEIIIAESADDALGRLHAYQRGIGLRSRAGGDDWLIGVTLEALGEVVSRLRAAGAPLRPLLTARRGWWGRRFGLLMLGCATALAVDDRQQRVAFLAPLPRVDTAATTLAGLRRSLRASPFAARAEEIFPGRRPGYLAMPLIATMPHPIDTHGIPMTPGDPAVLAAVAPADECAHQGAHWLECRTGSSTPFLALACPRCLAQRLDVVEAHRIPEDSLHATLRPESEDERRAYIADLARQRALLGRPPASREWEDLCVAEAVVDLAERAAGAAPWRPAPAIARAGSYSLEDAFFG